MKGKICKDIDECMVPGFFLILGKKWTFPLLCRLKPYTGYSFEEIVRLMCRQVHRATISYILRAFIAYKLILKKDKKYQLTEKGIKIRKKSLEIANDIVHSDFCKVILSE